MSEDLTKLQHEVEKSMGSLDFIEKTCQQLNKDLTGLSNQRIIGTGLTPEFALEMLTTELEGILLTIDTHQLLAQFIYRVDLSEELYSSALRHSDYNELAYQIIRREAQKVYLRTMLSN